MRENKQKTVLIGMPNASGQVPTVVMQSLLQLHKPLPCAFMFVERQRVDKARNSIAMEALNKEFDYLFFVDDDNPIPPDALELMLADDKDVVIAAIVSRTPNKQGKHTLCAFYTTEYDIDESKLNIYKNIETFRDNGPLHKVDAGGTGCMLIKRKVLEAMNKKYDDYIFEFGDIRFKKTYTIDGVSYNRRTMSEDCEFSERIMKLGFEMWLDDRIRPTHITSIRAVQWTDKDN